MLKNKNSFFHLIFSLPTLLSGCTTNENTIEIIEAHASEETWYPCHLNYMNKRLSIDEIRFYKHNALYKYRRCASEGIYTLLIQDGIVDEEKPFIDLKISVSSKKINYFGEIIRIEKNTNDTLFAVRNNGDYVIFKGLYDRM